jgi:TPR repeat protein
LLRSAADQGDAKAQLHLGVMFTEGQGVPQDHAQAAQWYRRAADQGEPHAQYNLGIFYATGEGGHLDSVSAYMWLTLAIAQFPAADAQRPTAVTSRDLIAKQMTHDQIMEAQKRASEWKPK